MQHEQLLSRLHGCQRRVNQAVIAQEVKEFVGAQCINYSAFLVDQEHGFRVNDDHARETLIGLIADFCDQIDAALDGRVSMAS